MDPIPETVEAINELDPSDEDGGLVEHLTGLASLARRVVPELVGVSVAQLEDRLAFTLVATDDEIAALDGVQYAAGAPVLTALTKGKPPPSTLTASSTRRHGACSLKRQLLARSAAL